MWDFLTPIVYKTGFSHTGLSTMWDFHTPHLSVFMGTFYKNQRYLAHDDTHLAHVYPILHTFTFCGNPKNQHKTQKSGSAELSADPDFLCNRVRENVKQ